MPTDATERAPRPSALDRRVLYQRWPEIEEETSHSKVQRAVDRLERAGLYDARRRRVVAPAADEFFVHALKYLHPIAGALRLGDARVRFSGGCATALVWLRDAFEKRPPKRYTRQV